MRNGSWAWLTTVFMAGYMNEMSYGDKPGYRNEVSYGSEAIVNAMSCTNSGSIMSTLRE